MSRHTLVRVELRDRSYDIHVGQGLLSGVLELMATRVPLNNVVIISDTNVAPLYAQPLLERLDADSRSCSTTLITVPAGEASKSVAQAHEIWDTMAAHQVDRSTVVVAVGGGVVGDLAGFTAATYARGLGLVQIPTSLLSQVDSSVGGKTAVNLVGGKNLVGSFWQPRYVVADVDVLRSLPDREFRSGMAEVIKYGVIADAELFTFLEQNTESILTRDGTTLTHVVKRCCQIKAEVVADDERETSGKRATLNYGHTFGHAIEAITKYERFLHGEAIAIGMVQAAQLAANLGLCDRQLGERQKQLLQAFGLPISWEGGIPRQLLPWMRRDKKALQGQIRLVLPTQLGSVELTDNVSDESILSVL